MQVLHSCHVWKLWQDPVHTKSCQQPHEITHKRPTYLSKCKIILHWKLPSGIMWKLHHLNPYLCDTDGCTWKTHSYALHLEHTKYGHLNEKLFVCKFCDCKYQMPTQLYSHQNKVHGIKKCNTWMAICVFYNIFRWCLIVVHSVSFV